MVISSEIIAGLGGALLGALVTGIFGWLAQRTQQTDTYKREFQDAVTALVDLREKFQLDVMNLSDENIKESSSSFLNSKLSVRLETAEFLAEKLGTRVAPSEYTILAQELLYASNFHDAERFYLKAVKSAKARRSKVAQAMHIRNIAEFYYWPGPSRNYEKGRSWFKNAAETLKFATDPYSLYILGLTHEAWGFQEWSNGFVKEGKRQMLLSEKYYSDLPFNFIHKKSALTLLKGRVQQLEAGHKELTPPVTGIEFLDHATSALPTDPSLDSDRTILGGSEGRSQGRRQHDEVFENHS